MHYDRRDSSDDAGNGLPIKGEEAFQIHRRLQDNV